jgi:hypothetical protein
MGWYEMRALTLSIKYATVHPQSARTAAAGGNVQFIKQRVTPRERARAGVRVSDVPPSGDDSIDCRVALERELLDVHELYVLRSRRALQNVGSATSRTHHRPQRHLPTRFNNNINEAHHVMR